MAPATTLQVPAHKRQFWAEFFGLYQRLPVLWDSRNELYKYRTCKFEAYDRLVDKLREIEPQADRQDVLRKINIFRTNYRRERARVLSSDNRGKNYKSTLWYYDMLSFLQTQETNRRSKISDGTGKMIPLPPPPNNGALDYTLQHNELSDSNWSHMEYSGMSNVYDCKRSNLEEYLTDASSMWPKNPGTTAPVVMSSNASNDHDHATSMLVTKDELQTPPPPPMDTQLLSPKLEISENAVAAVMTTPRKLLEETDCNERPKLVLRNLSPEAAVNDDFVKSSATLALGGGLASGSGSGGNGGIGDESCILSAAASILARSWAIQYDEMAPEQKIYARKGIAEILFEGCMGKLGPKADRTK